MTSILNFQKNYKTKFLYGEIVIYAHGGAYNGRQAQKTSIISAHYPRATIRTIILAEILILANATALKRICAIRQLGPDHDIFEIDDKIEIRSGDGSRASRM